MTKKSHSEATSADKTSIGFEFQYYFFLCKLLVLEPGQSIGLEVKDDVHTELDNDFQIFYQVKHTIHECKNLQTRDIDLWKTLSNWSKVIGDKYHERETIGEQLKFIQKTEFILFSNKVDGQNNEIINLIEALKSLSIDIDAFTIQLKKIKTKTKTTSKIVPYIDDLLNLDQSVLYNFVLKVGFELSESDIFGKINQALKAKMVDDQYIEQVFRDLDSDIRKDNFIEIKTGGKIQIRFDDFYRKYRKHFKHSNIRLKIRPFQGDLPSHSEMANQIFIKKLVEVGDIQDEDFDEISEYTTHRLKLKNNLLNWHINGEITNLEIDEFDSNTKTIWKNKFRKKRRKVFNNDVSCEMIDELRELRLSIDSQEIDIEMSNGEFYQLSDNLEIGWTEDWEEYKS